MHLKGDSLHNSLMSKLLSCFKKEASATVFVLSSALVPKIVSPSPYMHEKTHSCHNVTPPY